MSDSMQDLLDTLQAEQSREQFLWEITRVTLSMLPPAVEAAAYRGFILHWFNPQLLTAVMDVGRPSHLKEKEASSDEISIETIYEQLQELSFVEAYPERGHNFHDVTRDAVLAYLWREEREFYRAVSQKAAEYFSQGLDADEGIDWEIAIERLYHALITDEETAVAEIDELVADLASVGLAGHCESLVQVIEEHAKADRVSSDTMTLLQYWKLVVAYLNNNLADVEQLAAELLSADDKFVSSAIKAYVRRYLADGLRLAGRYDESQEVYETLRRELEAFAPGSDLHVEALQGLGHIAVARSDYTLAENYFLEAIYQCIRSLVFIVFENEEGELIFDVGLNQDEKLPGKLRWFDPLSWDYWETEPEESEAEEESESSAEPELVLFSIDIEGDDTESLAPAEQDGEIPFLLIVADTRLADSWLNLAYIYDNRAQYDLGAASGRLAGQIYSFLDSMYGAQRALQFLFGLATNSGDLELRQLAEEFQHQLLQMAVETEDPFSEMNALLGLAEVQLQRSDLKEARENYERALALAQELDDPTNQAIALVGLANLDTISGDLDLAETHIREAHELYQNLGYREGEARLVAMLGQVKIRRYDWVKAIEYFESALDSFKILQVPDGEIEALRGLADVSQLEGRFEQAIEYYQQVMEITRQHQLRSEEVGALRDIALVYESRGDYEQANQKYNEALALARDVVYPLEEAATLLALSNLAIAQGEFSEAEKFIDNAEEIYGRLELPASELEVLFARLNLYQAQKKGEQVVTTSEKAYALAQKLGDTSQMIRALHGRVNGLWLLEKYDQLLEVIDQALNLQPDNPELLAQKGNILCEFAEYETAVTVLDQATSINAGYGWAYQLKGSALRNLGQTRGQECLAAYSAALKIESDNVWVQDGIAEAYYQLGETEKAKEQSKRLVKQLTGPDSSDDDLYLLAWAYYRLGRYEEAKEIYQKILGQDHDSPYEQFDYALCLMSNGDYDQAQAQYERAIELVNHRQPPGRRGPLYVAIFDLREASVELTGLQEAPEFQKVMKSLEKAWTEAST